MMKRMISVFLVIIMLTFSCKPVVASEINSNLAGSVSGKKLFQYMQKSDGKLLVSRANYGYMNFIEEFQSNSGSLYLIEMIDQLIGTGAVPNKEKYMEVLLNIIATYDFDCADDIVKQRSRDNLKTLQDYALDCIKMGTNAVSTMIESNPEISELETVLSTAVGGLDVLTDSAENWIGALSNLETIIQNYSKYDDLLGLVEEKSKGELREAAKTLREGLEEAIKVKLNTYQDISDENYENYEEFFFTDVFFNAAKQNSEYQTDEGFKFFVDLGDEIVSRIETLKQSWELGTLIGTMVGNVTVGGENLINRVLEIMAIYDISIILQEEIIEVGNTFLKNLGKDTEESYVDTYVVLSQYLIGCRIRGEYCLYSIVANEAGLLSWFHKESAEEAKRWYEDKTEKVLKIQNSLLEILEKEDIEISSYFNHYEKLVDELNMERTDSWKFPSGNTYITDQFYLEIYEDLFSMKNEGTDFITLYGIKVGDFIDDAEKILLNNDWVPYYSHDGENVYRGKINQRDSLLCLIENSEGMILQWDICNFSEEEGGPEY